MSTDNKHIVAQALAELIETGDVAALASLLHEDFVHHRPGSSSTKAQWLDAVRALPLAELRVEIQHMLADGPHVVMHSKRSLVAGAPEITGVDIWRLENGLIVEAWEILEPAADAAHNMLWWKTA